MDAVGDGARAVGNLVRPDPSVFEFLGLGADVDVMCVDVDVVAGFEVDVTTI